MKRTVLCFFVLGSLAALPAFGQSYRSLNNDGVDQYQEKKYGDAEINFRKGIEKEPGKFKGYFNLGDNYYKQGKYDEAIKSYKDALSKAKTGSERADAYHNIGNALLKKNDYQGSIDAFKKSLKVNPGDKETKYNLSYALNMLKNQQNQQNKNQNNKDKNQDKNKDNQNKNQNKNDKNKNNDQNKNDQNKDNKDQQSQQQPQQSPPKVKKEEAERMLEALKNNEQDLQKKLRKKAVVKAKTDKDW
jgi:tetratricopeptide (TPR) repeat protein